jgi:hypothetical protein
MKKESNFGLVILVKIKESGDPRNYMPPTFFVEKTRDLRAALVPRISCVGHSEFTVRWDRQWPKSRPFKAEGDGTTPVT